MSDQTPEETPVEAPFRVMFVMNGFGTLEEMMEVVYGVEEDAEKRGLFPDIKMMNEFPVEELDDFPDDHPLVILARERNGT